VKVTSWTKRECYSDSWNGLIFPEAYSHPAKFAPGLIRKILQYGFEQGYWQKGDVIGDCFGGIGGGGIMAAAMGLKWIGCELEPRFVTLGQENFKLHYRNWLIMGYPIPVLIQGDSRHFSELVGEVGGILSSPPYISGGHHPDQTGSWGGLAAHKGFADKETAGYGKTDGQIGQMKPGNLAACITSPPYADQLNQGETRDPDKIIERERRYFEAHPELKGIRPETRLYSSNPANIGNLKAGDVNGIVTSPPFGEQQTGGDAIWDKLEVHHNRKFTERSGREHGYKIGQLGTSPGQIGQTTSTTYWQAVADVYRSCHQALKPGGIMCLVVKSYVKAGRRVPLPMQTLKLLIKLGFQPIERIKAMLVEETVTAGLFGDVTRKRQRKSFFRLLAERKGSPSIDWEEVLIVQKLLKPIPVSR
jgi:DNA modification methylase